MKLSVISVLAIGILLSFSACSRILKISVQFLNIDSEEQELSLRFNVADFKDKPAGAYQLAVFRSDTLLFRINHDISFSSWEYPLTSDGFQISYPEGATELPVLYKTDDLHFVFQGSGTRGTWQYRPDFHFPRNRWQFDQGGKQVFSFNVQYEPWLGKDVVRIQLSEARKILPETIELRTTTGKAIPFRLVYKQNPATIFALALEQAIKTGTHLHLSVTLTSGEQIQTDLTVMSKNQIGIAGKYHDL